MTKTLLDVLVIDDDDLTAEIIERDLRKVGMPYRVVAACDGQDGLDVLIPSL
jgi:CheY-like chemotaxis protein